MNVAHVRHLELRTRELHSRFGILPITHMFDYLGDETNDPCEAWTCVAGPAPNGEWVSTTVTEDERAEAAKVQ